MNLSLSGGANWTFQLDEGEKPAYFDEEYLALRLVDAG